MADDNRHTTTASRQDSKSPQKAQLQLNDIKAEAQRLGFFACGAARAEAVDAKTAATVRSWLDKGSQANMAYMANYTEKRLDPRLLVPGVKTILVHKEVSRGRQATRHFSLQNKDNRCKIKVLQRFFVFYPYPLDCQTIPFDSHHSVIFCYRNCYTKAGSQKNVAVNGK